MIIVLVAGALVAPGRAAAESPTEAKLRDALRAANAQLRAAEDEKARAQASEAALQKKVEALEAQVAAASRQPRGNPRAEAELRAALAAKTSLAGGLAEKLSRCEAETRESADAARAVEQQRSALAGQVGPLQHQLTTCEEKNAAMYRLARELLDRYANVGFRDVVGAREPFVGTARVRLENLAQDYGDRLADQRVAP